MRNGFGSYVDLRNVQRENEALRSRVAEAGAEFASGQAANAVRKARSAKAKAEELINQLEVQV